jgi:hypothetical protein
MLDHFYYILYYNLQMLFAMNEFLELESCLLAAIDNLISKGSKRPQHADELRAWIHSNSKKIGTEAKRLMTRYLVDVTSDPVWYEKFSSAGYRPDQVENWKKYTV